MYQYFRVCWVFLVGYFLLYSGVFAVEDNGGEKWANYLWWDVVVQSSLSFFTNALSYKPLSNKRTIVDEYCRSTLSNSMASGKFLFSGNQITFNSKNSLFVRGLCYAWSEGDPRPTPLVVEKELIGDVFKEDFVKKLKLKQMKGTEDVCATADSDECDIPRYASKVYAALMSDIFKIKRAHFLQVESVKSYSADKAERIAKVFEVFFSTQESSKTDYLFLYPKTSAMIDNNQGFFAKSLQTLVMLDNDKLAKQAQTDDCTLESPIFWFVCGLHMPNNLGTNQHFVNFIMNEYLHYRLFVDFYVNQQQKRINNNIERMNIDKQNVFTLELRALFQQREMYEQALRAALMDFQDFVATYPFHLGFVWYQEQLLKFRNTYATKMVTPFYSLYEKLRNVQPPEK